MAQLNEIILNLRKAALLTDRTRLSDGELLGSFLDHHDEAAVAALIQRHASMVWGVCRRLLNHHDAEDAFQATFLILVRKAASISPRGMVGNWLYGVACQTARKARQTAAKRQAREKQMISPPEPAVGAPDASHDWRALLDQELSRLPAPYRAAIILCDLEENTHKQAAEAIGVPVGTLSARLVRGRALLAKRLARRGLGVSGGVLAGCLAQETATAGVPPTLLSSTTRAAAMLTINHSAATALIPAPVTALVQGVLRTMMISRMRTGTLAVVAALVVIGGIGLAGSLSLPQAADRSGRPDPSIIPASGKHQQKGRPHQGDGWAWGKSVAGLQVGLRVRPRTKSQLEVGGVVQWMVKIRNTGKAPVDIAYVSAPFETFRPTVRDKNSQGMRVFMPPFASRAKQLIGRTLKPGDELEIGKEEAALGPKGTLVPIHLPELRFADPKTAPPNPQVESPTVYAPAGEYRVSYAGFIQSHAKLSTGALMVKVMGENVTVVQP